MRRTSFGRLVSAVSAGAFRAGRLGVARWSLALTTADREWQFFAAGLPVSTRSTMLSIQLRGILFFVWMAAAAALIPASGRAQEVEVGPILNNADAQNKCIQACGTDRWDGTWHATPSGAACSCAAFGRPAPAPVTGGASCSAPSTRSCQGCAVACPAGHQASCTFGEDFGTSGSSVCRTNASCRCL